jgi:glycerate kinase
MEQGVLEALPGAQVYKVPIADGGEGTVEAIISSTRGGYYEADCAGPLGQKVKAIYGIFGEPRTAVIEMASASGITLLSKEELNPLLTTTYGTGQLISAALAQGCRRIIIGIGGSATNDGGVGMAQALGIRFLDAQGEEIGYGGGQLKKISTIEMSGLDKRIAGCEIIAASDVTNPLCGTDGASAVFGPQKGATPEMVDILDEGLAHLSNLIHEQLHTDISRLAGGGAAGGLGAGLTAFLGATIERGIDIVLKAADFDTLAAEADLVITGEGRTDRQTAFGKTPVGVAKRAKQYNKPVICVSGAVSPEVSSLYELGLDVIIGATQAPMSLEDAIGNAPAHIRHAVSSAVRAVMLSSTYRMDKRREE